MKELHFLNVRTLFPLFGSWLCLVFTTEHTRQTQTVQRKSDSYFETFSLTLTGRLLSSLFSRVWFRLKKHSSNQEGQMKMFHTLML